MAPNTESDQLRSELSKAKEKNSELEQQVKNAIAERDLLAVMLNEAENGQSRQAQALSPDAIGGWDGVNKEARSVASFANLSVAVLVLSGRGKIKTASTWTKKLTGFSRTELMDKEIAGLFKRFDIFDEIQKLADTGNSQMIEAQLKPKSGELILVGLMVSPRQGDQILVTIVDLGNRRPLSPI
jgi:PAS domain S-box-containing protein